MYRYTNTLRPNNNNDDNNNNNNIHKPFKHTRNNNKQTNKQI